MIFGISRYQKQKVALLLTKTDGQRVAIPIGKFNSTTGEFLPRRSLDGVFQIYLEPDNKEYLEFKITDTENIYKNCIVFVLEGSWND